MNLSNTKRPDTEKPSTQPRHARSLHPEHFGSGRSTMPHVVPGPARSRRCLLCSSGITPRSSSHFLEHSVCVHARTPCARSPAFERLKYEAFSCPSCRSASRETMGSSLGIQFKGFIRIVEYSFSLERYQLVRCSKVQGKRDLNSQSLRTSASSRPASDSKGNGNRYRLAIPAVDFLIYLPLDADLFPSVSLD